MYTLKELQILSEDNNGSFEFETTWITAKDLPWQQL